MESGADFDESWGSWGGVLWGSCWDLGVSWGDRGGFAGGLGGFWGDLGGSWEDVGEIWGRFAA